MALQPCRECGSQISTEATVCPRCGVPDPTRLTPEDKVADRHAKMQSSFATRDLGWKKGCLIIVGVFALVIWFASMCADTETTTSDTTSQGLTLNAEVSFDGTQFSITNNDSFPWSDVELDLNGGTFTSGFVLRPTMQMQPAETYTVGAAQFAKGDGTRFNPFQMKPQRFCVLAKNPQGQTGVSCMEWRD
jgi:hypothetical protein